jgi:outer membrane protein assembly factor BamB
MKQNRIHFTLIFLLTIVTTLVLSCGRREKSDVTSQDWFQYLGPDRNSTSDQKGILRSWPAGGPEILWTVDVGPGNGGPIITDGKVYLLDRDDEVGDNLRCFSLSNGKELWNFGYDAPGSVRFHGSRSVPAADGNNIYTCGHNGDLYCTDINTHKPVWHKNIWTDFGGEQLPTWAIVQCPLVYGDLVIIASQAPDAGVVAYDKLTGDVVWKTPPIGPLGYVSPSIARIDGEDHVVMITAASRGAFGESSGGRVVGIDPHTGEILWEYTNWSCAIPVPSAYDAGESRVLIVGGYNAGAAMIKVKREEDSTYIITELYKNPDFGAHTKPPVLYKGYFYAQYTTNERRDGLVCMSMDGQVMWKTGRSPEFNKGSMILADGLILATNGDKTLYLIEPDPSGFNALASADVLEIATDLAEPKYGNQNWAPMALADGRLLLRDQHHLVCVRVAE